MNCKKQTKCRFCGNNKLVKYLDLNKQPPSNSFILKKNIKKQTYYPLDLLFCKKCNLSQLSVVLDNKEIFDEYVYYSSTSKQLVEHYLKTVKFNIKKYNLKKNDKICDIGSNDGVLISRYPKNYNNLIGIEPSKASNQMKDKRISLIKDFFSQNSSNKILKKHGKMKFISITNVYAHIDNIHDFNKGLVNIMDKESILMIEFPYLLDMIDNTFYDLIYHEHLSYLSLTPLKYLFDKHKMKIIDLKKVNIGASGPALRVYATLKSSTRKISKKIKKQLEYEKKWGINKLNTYKKFQYNVNKNSMKLINLIKSIHPNQKIGCFSAPAKGNTLLNFCNFNNKILKFVSENNKDKIGKYTPGSNIEIISDANFIKKNFKFALLLSWNYKEYFLKNSIFYQKGGKFIVPFPFPKIL